MNLSNCFFFLAPLAAVQQAFAFVPLLNPQQLRMKSFLSASSEPGGSNGDAFDIEEARSKFESMMDEVDCSSVSTSLDNQPLMTTINRIRRENEILLLEALENDEEVAQELWLLWYNERGRKANIAIREGEEWMNAKQWGKAEQRFKDLIGEYGIYWAEPVNRLATLYFLQGRMEESKQLCEVVLQVKPWHFGALNGIVMVCAHLQDAEATRKWAARRLPTLAPEGTTNPRREEWVEEAVDSAKQLLEEEETRLRLAFGPQQSLQAEGRKMTIEMEDDAWQ